MIPEEFEIYFRKITPWLDVDKTPDGFKAGNPKQEITKAAVSWKASWEALKTAKEKGCNFFISHESIFASGHIGNEMDLMQYHELEKEKAEWIAESGMCIYRCHDTIDLLPNIGVRDQWLKGLGLTDYEIMDAPGYHALCRIQQITLGKLASDIHDRVKNLGQNGVMVMGDSERVIHTVATGTGAITDPFVMASCKPDCCIITDDYFRTVRDGEFLKESGSSMIMLNHGVSEEWGMVSFCNHLQKVFSRIEFTFIPHSCIYRMMI
jgi:putative NIF3 family GTP cyclohydrolase 1 type 2